MNRGAPNPPAREEDIVRVEQLVGCTLPSWLRSRLLVENGFELDDSIGVTGHVWRILPVMDRANRKRIAKTAEDVAWHTARARAVEVMATPGFDLVSGRPFPAAAVVIGHGWSRDDRLMLLPDPADPTVLGAELYQQSRDGQPKAHVLHCCSLLPCHRRLERATAGRCRLSSTTPILWQPGRSAGLRRRAPYADSDAVLNTPPALTGRKT